MNLRKTILLSFALLMFAQLSIAQMEIGGQTLYGNEWIKYEQSHYKILLEEDGVYRVSFQELTNAGVFNEANPPSGADLKLFNKGVEIPIYVSTTGTLGNGDFVEFYGQSNKGEIDRYLFDGVNDQLNPNYSFFTEESAYFLTWNNDPSTNFTQESNDLSNPPAVEPYCILENEVVFNNVLVNGKDYDLSSSYKCKYDIGEGYSSAFDVDHLISLPSENLSSNNSDAFLKVRLFGNHFSHDLSIEVNSNSIFTETFGGWELKQYTIPVPINNLNNGNNSIEIFTNTNLNPDDKVSVSSASLIYPSDFSFSNTDYIQFKLPSSNSKRYLDITDFNITSQDPIVLDITNNIRLQATISGSNVRVVLPASNGEREIIIYNENQVKSINEISKRDFVEYDFDGGSYDYLMVTHPYFFNDGNGNNLIQEYADYRASQIGGGYSPLIVDVTQLYDQFAYGIDRHEIGIKNFLKKAEIEWAPKLLYLIGKGATYNKMRTDAANWQQFSFVPSFGFPSSDHLFVTPNDSPIPSMGVGRIAIKSHDQLELYFNKVKEFDNVQITSNQTLEDKEWMKKVLHFGGGDELIQNMIKDRLNDLKDTIETSTMAADVISFFKNSTGTIEEVDLDLVVPLINDGAAMLSFFGHSAPSTLDFDLGDPNEYENAGKYPLFYAIGCNTNRIFEVESTLSENFVLIENKGCIGFFGATWITSLSNLSQYGRAFYSNLGNDNYGDDLGTVIKETIIDYSGNMSYTAELLRNALVLHGDPAVKLFPHQTPDYIVNEPESLVSPNIVNVEEDSFDLELVIGNVGKGIDTEFQIHLENELPDGSIEDLGMYTVEAPYFESTFSVRLPILGVNTLGANYIRATLDINDDVLEAPIAAEANNIGRIPYFVVANDIFPVYPYDFSIISDNDVTLKASTANVFSESLKYYFEIDTTELFNSPLNETAIIEETGGIIDWNPNITMLDNTVYYWRVSIDSAEIAGNGGFNWHNSSFIYIDQNPPGWNQSHYYQQIKDDLTDYEIDPITWEQSYTNFTEEFKVQNGTFPTLNFSEIKIFRDGFVYYGFAPCGEGNNTFWINVLDPNTLDVKLTEPGQGINFNCFGSDAYVSITNPNTFEGREKTIDFLQNEIEDGEYVIIFTTQGATQDFSINDWAADSIPLGTNIFQLLEAQGATQIRDMVQAPTPYIFMYKHNDPSFPITEVKASNLTDIIEGVAFFEGNKVSGEVRSTTIGPASTWETLLWNVSDYDPTTENVNVDVYGINNDGNEIILLDSITNYVESLSTINAETYPYIKLVYNSVDSVARTTPQLDYWRVHYVPIPEAALVPNKEFTFLSDTLQQGEPLQLSIGVENISEVDMDSMLMHYTIIGSDNTQVLTEERMEPLINGEMIIGEFDFDTRNLTGLNRVLIEANPNDDQKELYHYNNIGVREFYIENDKRNPLLDVTFDGTRIMDGDIVSSKPEIIITLRDENQYLALADSSLLRVFLTDPNDVVTEYNIDGSTLLFYPANQNNLDTENKARLDFYPELTVDGVYELRVRGKDASGNNSGDLDYRVTFEVINEELVSNVLNYPNPFSTSTQFVFTLTGSELPDYMKIQIMTVSGKVVKEITMDELGPLRIGNNITDYRWDGTDEYGDKLANGVYLYRVISKLNGEDYGKYDTGTNQFFKKDFGKMMILR